MKAGKGLASSTIKQNIQSVFITGQDEVSLYKQSKRQSATLAPRQQSRPSSTSTQETNGYYIKNTLDPEKKKLLIEPQQFKANTIFTYLSHSIYNENSRDKNGRLISPNNPPEYITYNMLIREIGIYMNEELITEKELKRQFKIATAKEQKALKSELWRVWYNIIVGDDKDEDVPSKKSQLTRRRSIGGVSGVSNSVSGGIGTPRTSPNASPSLAPTPEELVYYDFLIGEMEKYMSKADKTKKDRYGYTEHDYEKDYFRFATKHASVAISKAYDTKILLRKKIYEDAVNIHDIVCDFKPNQFPYPDPSGFITLFRPNNKLHLYGMQLPHQFNRELLLNSMIYLFHKKIYNIADLQGCADAINRQNSRMNIGIGCNPYDRDCEPLMWDIAKRLTQSQPESKCLNIQATTSLSQEEIDNYELKPDELEYLKKGNYYNLKVKDMTAGYLWSWNEISKIKDVSKPENSIVVHCLAGAGRTGSVMIYLLLRDTRNCLEPAKKKAYEDEIKDRLSHPHFGFSNIREVIAMLRAYFVNYNSNTEAVTGEVLKIGSKIMDRQTADMLKQKGVDTKTIQTIIAQGLDTATRDTLLTRGIDIATIKAIEKQQVKSQATTTLLRQRLNRIFFFLAKEFNVKEFYTYGRPTKQVIILPNDEFSNPVKRVVSDWNRYDRDVARGWIN